MTGTKLSEIAKQTAKEGNTVYLWGTFGAPLTEKLITQKAKQYPKNYSEARKDLLRSRTDEDLWAFDCVGLIKGILWGWKGDWNKKYGGAVYEANGVPDIGANAMAARCTEKSKIFDGILPGEAVFRNGHIGIYVGDGTVVEATLRENLDGVVLTSLEKGNWEGHGKLPWVSYQEEKTFRVGDTVRFFGGKHYASSSGSIGFNARPGNAKITKIVPGRKHPYHLIKTDKTTNVYGWVDEGSFEKIQ